MARILGTNQKENGTLGEELVDEFTAPGEQREMLLENRAKVQSLFPVVFTILGSLENVIYELQEEQGVPARIWVQLQGKQEAVHKAKEYIKGLSDPAMYAKETYPKEMHCIFAGAHGFFLNSLIRDTCANIAVLEIGTLSIQGATELVVMAQSKIQQYVKIFRENGSLLPHKELEVKRRFKCFVEAHADKYTMDLLLLPCALKEELLILISNDPPHPALDDSDLEIIAVTNQAHDLCSDSQAQARPKTRTPVTELMCQLDSVFPRVPESNPTCLIVKQERANSKRRGSEKENACRKKPFSLEEVQSEDSSEIPVIDLVSDAADDSDIIILDQEPISAKTEHKICANFFTSMGYPVDVVEKVIADLGESAELAKLLEEIVKRSKPLSGLPNQQAINLEKNQDSVKQSKPLFRPANQLAEISEKNQEDTDVYVVKTISQPRQEVTTKPVICLGPPNGGPVPKWTAGTSSKERTEAERKNISFVARGTSGPSRRLAHPEEPGPSNQPPVIIVKEIPVKASHTNHSAVPSFIEQRPVTHGGQTKPGAHISGVEVFLNTIKTPYKLELKNDPGRGDLKHIIIDGSNVAMCHGLQRFFSCRGIAIAVEYFWKRGHRKITVFVPQWRTKRDNSITEQHFLKQLEELGILSFTPARTVLGSRIASHDDRFLLHLAEKTGGVIITKDNLREFVGESPAWMKIIRERLLQYTFVGDIFMLPDDPLGRHGPKLDEFLSTRLEQRQVPDTSPPDSGVFFPSQDAFFSKATSSIAPLQPRFFLPNSKPEPAIANLPRPRATVPIPLVTLPPQPATVPPQRSYHETISLKDKLLIIFPEKEQMEKINQVLTAHPYMRDLNALSAMILD
ncbi:NEDD4-binding protein 1 [Gastrophryne carolinensis]